MKIPKNCPLCGSEAKDAYTQIRCSKCGLSGPWTNGGINDAHADHQDHFNAVKNWNQLVDTITNERAMRLVEKSLKEKEFTLPE